MDINYGFYGCGEYQVFKSKYIFKVSKDLPFENAGFCEPLATVICGIQKIRIEPGQNVLVIGAGTMGVLNSLVARYYGANVTISEVSTKKLGTAKNMGFNKLINICQDNYAKKIKDYTNEKGLDAIIIAVGNTKAYNQALEIASKDCKLLIFASGYPSPEWNLDPNTVHYKLLEIIGTYGCSTADYQKATDLLSDNEINVTPLIEEKYSLDDIQRAFEKATTPDTYRISVVL
jgi:threonine dehydrogenase-like Zn-dependent dehydrogenase